MLTSSEVASMLSRFPKFEDSCIGLPYAPRMPKHMVKETREVIAIARKFNEEVAKPLALKLDRLTHGDPDYLPWELVEEANRWGFYTMWVPKMFGGQGYNMPSSSFFLEEIASACAGIANVIGVHYLAVAGLIASGNARISKRVLRDVIDGEKSGKPCLLALATTEPGAGTDVEEVDLVDKGRVTCNAKRVEGGYIVNGTKVFISMGHVSTWTVLSAYEDVKRPSETNIGFVVKTGARGFSFGSHENKMGQRACPASVLIFEDCFIPDDQVIMSAALMKKYSSQPNRDVLTLKGQQLKTSAEKVNRFKTFSLKDGVPLAANIYMNPIEFGKSMSGKATKLTLGDHDIARHLREIKLSEKPLFYQYMPVMEAILYGARNLMDD